MLGLSSIRERRMLVEPKLCAAGYIRELVLAGKVEPRLSDLDEGGHTRFWLTPNPGSQPRSGSAGSRAWGGWGRGPAAYRP